MAQLYKRPPIAEAVIEIRVQDPISKELLDRLKDRLLKYYPALPQQTMALNVEIGEKAAKLQQQFEAYKLTSGDGSEVATLGPNVIGTSKLAPYDGWEPFIATTRRNWDVWKDLVGFKKLARIGVRYVNRIDVPNPEGKPVLVSEYLRFFPTMPEFGQPPMESFAINASAPVGADDCTLVLNASSVPSPLVKAVSFILDLDISKTDDIPQNDEKLWAFVEKVRTYKNRIFEACITDRARQLFS
jgi:uncharacterized protein (TIGR04255 family)